MLDFIDLRTVVFTCVEPLPGAATSGRKLVSKIPPSITGGPLYVFMFKKRIYEGYE